MGPVRISQEHLIPSLTASWHDQGIALLFHILHLVGDPLPTQGVGPWLRLLKPMYAAASQDSAIALTAGAVGMLTLASQHQKDASIGRAALSRYLQAVLVAQYELQDLQRASSDSTLMSVLLLSLAEVSSKV